MGTAQLFPLSVSWASLQSGDWNHLKLTRISDASCGKVCVCVKSLMRIKVGEDDGAPALSPDALCVHGSLEVLEVLKLVLLLLVSLISSVSLVIIIISEQLMAV